MSIEKDKAVVAINHQGMMVLQVRHMENRADSLLGVLPNLLKFVKRNLRPGFIYLISLFQYKPAFDTLLESGIGTHKARLMIVHFGFKNIQDMGKLLTKVSQS